jgi:hypothetical protein
MMGELRSGRLLASLGWAVTLAIGCLSVTLVVSQLTR